MYIRATTLDDLLREVLLSLLKGGIETQPSRGKATELTGVLLHLDNPLARLSRTETRGRLFSCVGELVWYLAKTDDLAFIEYYVGRYKEESDDGRTVYGAYGPRLFRKDGIDQVANIIKLLRSNPESRRAVIQLFDARDLVGRPTNIPCTCTLQFLLRRKKLIMVTSMRSNDAFIGLPHDVFAFTMLQEIIARTLSVDIGSYKHAIGSLHLYEDDRPRVQEYLREGWQSTVAVAAMPPMPRSDPWRSIRTVLKAERAIRRGGNVDRRALRLHPYWMDFVRILQIYRAFKGNQPREISRLKGQMSVRHYDPYIEAKEGVGEQRRRHEKSPRR